MTTSNDSGSELDVTTVALELFKERSAQSGISPKQLAMECFRDATIFTNVAEEVLTAGIDFIEDDSDPLDVAFAPNLKRTHPINLMSRAWGDLGKVQAVLSHLDDNPSAERFEQYGWGKSEVNQARVLFPAVDKRTKQATNTK